MRRLALVGLAIGFLALVAACTPVKPPAPGPVEPPPPGAQPTPPGPQVVEVRFEFTGTVQQWTVPEGVTEVTVDAFGAQGGSSAARAAPANTHPGAGGGSVSAHPQPGGRGAHARATIQVTPNDTVGIYVGGRGGDGIAFATNTSADATEGTPGFNGGGQGGAASNMTGTGASVAAAGGGGGGFSGLLDCGAGCSPGSFRIVASGGGGGGAHGTGIERPPAGEPTHVFNPGGAGAAGGLIGADGSPGTGPSAGLGGSGGTDEAGAGGFLGGTSASPSAHQPAGNGGSLADVEPGISSAAFASAGGGGGGGDRGGGGGGRTYGIGLGNDSGAANRGGAGGGGGGSSTAHGGDGTETFETGVRAGNGLVVITYVL